MFQWERYLFFDVLREWSRKLKVHWKCSGVVLKWLRANSETFLELHFETNLRNSSIKLKWHQCRKNHLTMSKNWEYAQTPRKSERSPKKRCKIETLRQTASCRYTFPNLLYRIAYEKKLQIFEILELLTRTSYSFFHTLWSIHKLQWADKTFLKK